MPKSKLSSEKRRVFSKLASSGLFSCAKGRLTPSRDQNSAERARMRHFGGQKPFSRFEGVQRGSADQLPARPRTFPARSPHVPCMPDGLWPPKPQNDPLNPLLRAFEGWWGDFGIILGRNRVKLSKRESQVTFCAPNASIGVKHGCFWPKRRDWSLLKAFGTGRVQKRPFLHQLPLQGGVAAVWCAKAPDKRVFLFFFSG